MMVRMIGALFDDDNYTGLAYFSQMDQHPELVLFIVPMVLAMLRAAWSENLRAVASSLGQASELAAQMHRTLRMPSADVAANLA